MPRWLRVILTGSAFMWFGVMGAVFAYIIIPLGALGAKTKEHRARRTHAIFHKCFRIYIWYMRVLGLISVRYGPLPPVLAERKPSIIVANHPTLLDIVFLMAYVPSMTFLAKAGWFRSVALGPILRYGNHISGPEHADPVSGAMVLDGMLDRLSAGFSVMVFPEGTRSPQSGLRRFHRGGFEAAIRARVPVVPILIEVDPSSLRKDQRWYDVPERRINYTIRVLKIIEPHQLPETAAAVSGVVRQQYLEALNIHEAVAASSPASNDNPLVPEVDQPLIPDA